MFACWLLFLVPSVDLYHLPCVVNRFVEKHHHEECCKSKKSIISCNLCDGIHMANSSGINRNLNSPGSYPNSGSEYLIYLFQNIEKVSDDKPSNAASLCLVDFSKVNYGPYLFDKNKFIKLMKFLHIQYDFRMDCPSEEAATKIVQNPNKLSIKWFEELFKLIFIKEINSICIPIDYQGVFKLANIQTNNQSIQTSGYRGWLSSFLAISIISILSIGTIVIVAFGRKKKFYRYLLEILTGLAIGALLGDALVHLIPHSLADHDDHHDHHMLNAENPTHNKYSSENPIWQSIIIIASIYCFFTLEVLIKMIPSKYMPHNHSHNHHNEENDLKPSENDNGVELQNEKECCIHVCPQKELKNCDVEKHINNTHRQHVGMPADVIDHINETHSVAMVNYVSLPNQETVQSNSSTKENLSAMKKFIMNILKINQIAWMLTIGDTLHNFVDGIAIGVQFMKPWPEGLQSGITTTFAILLHEIPHEVGDNAAMIASGLSLKKTIFINAAATFSCFLGGLLGCTLGSITVNFNYIDSVVAGMFIYISMTLLLPGFLGNIESTKKPFILFLCQSLGLIIGVFVMVTLSFHEDILK